MASSISQSAFYAIKMRFPDDWHHHLRDGKALLTTVPAAAQRFRRVIAMPNLKPPVTTVKLAMAYRERILNALEESKKGQKPDTSGGDPFSNFEPLMTLYLTDNTPPSEIDLAVSSGIVKGVKLYPAGATTNSDSGVTNIENVFPTLERMAQLGMPLLVHGEVTNRNHKYGKKYYQTETSSSAEESNQDNTVDEKAVPKIDVEFVRQEDQPNTNDVDVFEREALFVSEVMTPLIKRLPNLRVVMEHITTAEAADFVMRSGPNIAATITPQHLRYNRNAIFRGGVRPHYYCLPILKHERHRQALLNAIKSGSPKFFAGTDSAPHPAGSKESCCGCAGCFNVHGAISFYAEAFEEVGKIEHLENFLSHNGPKFYNLPVNNQTMEIRKRVTLATRKNGDSLDDLGVVPKSLTFQDEVVIPLGAGQRLSWLIDGVDYEKLDDEGSGGDVSGSVGETSSAEEDSKASHERAKNASEQQTEMTL
eukprot:g3053.t1